MAAPLADGFVQEIVALRRAELRDIAHAEALDGFGDELEFRDRHQVERAHVEMGALGLGIEAADRFQAVAEEVEPHRLVEAGGEQVEDAAAHGVFAGLAHRRGAVVAIVLQPRDDRIHRHDIAGRDRQRLRRDALARRHPLHDGIDRGQHDQRLLAAGQARQPRQRGEPLRQHAAMRRDAVIGLAIPGRKLHHAEIGREELQRPGEILHPCAVAADYREADRRRLRPRSDGAGEVGDDQALGALGDIGKGQRAPGRQLRRGRDGRRLHRGLSMFRKLLMRSNKGVWNSGASRVSPTKAG